VPPNGYAWWYVDALSDCGRYGLTIIGFIGSVFSPYYAWARKRGPTDPFQHCALNVALYGQTKRWAMTERGRGDLVITPDRFGVGPSAMQWDGTALTITIDERCMPDQRGLRGTVRVTPSTLIDHEVLLNPEGHHRWRPFAPGARVEVSLQRPSIAWSGTGYFDSNQGDAPIEAGFSAWTWSRASLGDDTLVLYDATLRDGSQFAMARSFGAEGQWQDVPLPPPAELPRGLWGVSRPTRSDAGHPPVFRQRLEDAPFYTRSEITASLLGQPAHGVHESLDLDRFIKPWVQVLLPFRMPRIARR